MFLTIHEHPVSFRPHQKLRHACIPPGCFEQLMDIGFTISHSDQECVGTMLLSFQYGLITLDPLMAFLLLDRQTKTPVLFPEISGVAHYILKPEGGAFYAEGHGVMHQKPCRAFPFRFDLSCYFRGGQRRHTGFSTIMTLPGKIF